MKLSDFLETWGLTVLMLDDSALQREFSPNEADRLAAWILHVELITRLPPSQFVFEETRAIALLDRTVELFQIIRSLLKLHGCSAREFATLTVAVTNQVLRPFVVMQQECLSRCTPLRHCLHSDELSNLLDLLNRFTGAIGSIAGVAALTDRGESPIEY